MAGNGELVNCEVGWAAFQFSNVEWNIFNGILEPHTNSKQKYISRLFCFRCCRPAGTFYCHLIFRSTGEPAGLQEKPLVEHESDTGAEGERGACSGRQV